MPWISRTRYDKLIAIEKAAQSVDTTLQRIEARAHLIDIEAEGRKLKFIFARNGKIEVIETMAVWADNIVEWKKRLLG